MTRLAIVVVLLLGGCDAVFGLRRDQTEPVRDADGSVIDAPGPVTDGQSFDAAPPDAGCTWTPFTTVMSIAGFQAGDAEPTMTANKLELYVTRFNGGSSVRDIYVAKRTAPTDPWPAPSRSVELSSPTSDSLDPAITGNGLHMLMIRVTGSTRQLVQADRTSTALPFSAPVPLGGLPATVQGIDVAPNGLSIIYQDASGSLQEATRPNLTSMFVSVTSVASGGTLNRPSLSADRKQVYYHTTSGSISVISRRTRSTTSGPFNINFDDVLTDASDAEISSDGTELVYLSLPSGTLAVATRSCQ